MPESLLTWLRYHLTGARVVPTATVQLGPHKTYMYDGRLLTVAGANPINRPTRHLCCEARKILFEPLLQLDLARFESTVLQVKGQEVEGNAEIHAR